MAILEGLQQSSNKFLSQILPMLVQQQFQRQYIDYNTKAWLANQLKQYEAFGEQQRAGREEALRNAFAEQLFRVLGKETEVLPYASQEFMRRGRPIAETYGLDLPEPAAEYPEELGQYQQTFVDIARSLTTGEPPSDDTIRSAAKLFDPNAVREYMAQFGKEAQQRADRALRERELEVETAALPVRRLEAETGAGRLELEKETGAAEEWLRMVEDIEDHLRQEGVKKQAVDQADLALFGSGKVPDPLTAELRGKAYTHLGEIRTKIIQRKPLTPGEIRFLQTVRNSWQIKQPTELGGGLVSPETGMTEIELRNRTLQTVTQMIMEMTGLAEDQARNLAEKFIVSKIK